MTRRQDDNGGNDNDNGGGGANKDDNDGDIFHCTVTNFLLLVYVVCLSSLLQNDLKQYIRLMFSKPDIKISGGSKIKTG